MLHVGVSAAEAALCVNIGIVAPKEKLPLTYQHEALIQLIMLKIVHAVAYLVQIVSVRHTS